jgi:hypothetical protein
LIYMYINTRVHWYVLYTPLEYLPHAKCCIEYFTLSLCNSEVWTWGLRLDRHTYHFSQISSSFLL